MSTSPRGPTFPIKRLSRNSWTYHHQSGNDSDFSSNGSSYSPMQTLLLSKTEETTLDDLDGRSSQLAVLLSTQPRALKIKVVRGVPSLENALLRFQVDVRQISPVPST